MQKNDPSEKSCSLVSDYTCGAHPAVMRALLKTNSENTPGYGLDAYCEKAKAAVRRACRAPKADVWFLVGGTQTNAVVLTSLLKPWQGVIAAESGHIAAHEAGAVELGGHKVITLPEHNGKLDPAALDQYCRSFYADAHWEHMTVPGAVYLSQPTEYGTLYSLDELKAFRAVCDSFGLSLYIDGARLAYALACPVNDVSLSDLARLCDAFYIGGTKCGTLFGEAVVVPDPEKLPHFFTVIKQNGALLAKGRLLGVQFGALFTRGLYRRIGAHAAELADKLREGLRALGYPLLFDSPTNQVFTRLPVPLFEKLQEPGIGDSWSGESGGFIEVRFVTSWATREEETDRLLTVLKEAGQ